jgi:hypothetical protein
MEVHQLNASLNWDSKYEANPWDLSFADVDVAMRCYPTTSLQVPFNFIQADGQRGYSVGLEYSYDILTPKKRCNSDPNYSKFDPGSFERDNAYFDSANNPRFMHRDLDDVEGDEMSDDIYNVNSTFYQQQRGFEFDNADINDAQIEISELEAEGQINFGRIWSQFLRFLDIKYAQGIFKAHLQKPFYTNTNEANVPVSEDMTHDSLFRGLIPNRQTKSEESFFFPFFNAFPQVILSQNN